MELQQLRDQMDEVNSGMADLFARRMEISLSIARCKQAQGRPVADRSREREILNRIVGRVGEPLEGYARMLFETLFSLSRSYQSSVMQQDTALADEIRAAVASAPALFPQKAAVACQGVEGAYSQLACDRLFSLPDILYFSRFEGVFQAVEKGLCRYGILPIENSLFGSVGEVYDLMKKHRFYIVRSVRLRIGHALLARPGADLAGIKEIYSHGQAVGQCAEFLRAHPDIRVTICENTAAAARMVAESGRGDIAAISSKHCAGLYGLVSLADDIQDSDNNYTRFICISRRLEIYPGAGKISMMMALPHKPGSLYELLSRFAALGLNLTKLESRPIIGRDFEFMFYFDLEASVWSESVLQLLCELQSGPDQFVFLGSYSEI
jgi:chorismate mutase/prephenate dehydratase